MRRKDLVSGLLLIVVGLLFLAANFDAMPALHFGRLWPVILIAIGAGKILFPEGGARASGLPLLLVGCIFLAHNYRVIRLEDSWPLFIVAAGISMLVGSAEEARRKKGGQPS